MQTVSNIRDDFVRASLSRTLRTYGNFNECVSRIWSICSQAERNKYLKGQHHWLLLAMTKQTGNILTIEEDPLISLQSLAFTVDSHVTLAYRGSGVNQVLLQEVYRTGLSQPLVSTPLVGWSPGQVLPQKFKRDDYGGVSINAATVASSSEFCDNDCTNKFFTKPYIYIYI